MKILKISILTLFVIVCLMVTLSYATPSCTLLGEACSTAYTCDTCNAADPSLAEVQAAVNLTARGGTVNVPDGEATWTGALTINRAIKLKGGGNTEDANGTRITWANTTVRTYYSDSNLDCGLNIGDGLTGAPDNIFIWISDATNDENETMEITGFVFYQSMSVTKIAGIVIINGDVDHPLRRVMVHDNLFQYRTDSAASQWSALLAAHGYVYGVIYNNTINIRRPYFTVYGNRMDDGVNDSSCYFDAGRHTWDNHESKLGSLDALYFEDNTWNFNTTNPEHMGGSAIGGDGYVVRYNTYNNQQDPITYGQGGHDAHGSYRSGYPPKKAEVYGNYYKANTTSGYGVTLLHTRCGRNIVFNNLVQNIGTGSAGGGVTLVHECNECVSNFNSPTNTICTIGGACSGVARCSIDQQPFYISDTYIWQNRQGSTGSTLVRDGIQSVAGYGATTPYCAPVVYTGSWTNTSGTIYWATATTTVSYVKWNGTLLTQEAVATTTPALNKWSWISDTGRLYVNVGANPSTGTLSFYWYTGWAPVQNVEWWKDNTSCTGTQCKTGVGCGTTLPTCPNGANDCPAGVGFWLTDQSCTMLTTDNVGAGGTPATKKRTGTLYVRKNDQWVPYYTPAAYPHYLRDDVPSDTTAPFITNLSPTAQQPCDDLDDTEDITISFTATDQNQAGVTCYYDTESRANYAALAADGHAMSASGTTFSATVEGLACAASHTIWYACSDGTNDSAVGTWQFTIAGREDEAVAQITSATTAQQACSVMQKINISTDKPATCKWSLTDQAYEDMEHTFSVTGGETGHVAHSTDVSQNCSESVTRYIRCSTTQGVANTSSTAVVITTDAAKTISIGAGGLTLGIGSGSQNVQIIP